MHFKSLFQSTTKKCAICTFTILTLSSLVTPAQEPAAEQKLPEDVLRLKTVYQQAVEHAVQPLRDRYVADLTRLVDQATRAGRLDQALAIKNEIATVKVPSGSETFKNSRWEWFDSTNPSGLKSWVELNDDGKGKSSWDTVLKWKLTGRTLLIEQNDRGWHFQMDAANREGHTEAKSHEELRTIHFLQTIK